MIQKLVCAIGANIGMISNFHQHISMKVCKWCCANELDFEMHAFRSKFILFRNQHSQFKFTSGGTRKLSNLCLSGLHNTLFVFTSLGHWRVRSFKNMCAQSEWALAWFLTSINTYQYKYANASVLTRWILKFKVESWFLVHIYLRRH